MWPTFTASHHFTAGFGTAPVIETFACGHKRSRHDFGDADYAVPEEPFDTDAWARADRLAIDPFLVPEITIENVRGGLELFTDGPCPLLACQANGSTDVVVPMAYTEEERNRVEMLLETKHNLIQAWKAAADRFHRLNPVTSRTAASLKLAAMQEHIVVFGIDVVTDKLRSDFTIDSTGLEEFDTLSARMQTAMKTRSPHVIFRDSSDRAIHILHALADKFAGFVKLLGDFERSQKELNDNSLLYDFNAMDCLFNLSQETLVSLGGDEFDRETIGMQVFKNYIRPEDGVLMQDSVTSDTNSDINTLNFRANLTLPKLVHFTQFSKKWDPKDCKVHDWPPLLASPASEYADTPEETKAGDDEMDIEDFLFPRCNHSLKSKSI